MVAFFDNIGYIAPVIGVVVFFVVIMVVRKLMAGTPDTKEKDKKSDDEDEKKDSDDEKKDSKDEDEKKDPEEIEKKLVEDLDVEAGIVHKLKTDVTIEQDEADFDEALDSEVVGDIQAETAAIKEEASAEQRHNAAAEKKAMEHEKKTIGTLETDLGVIATQFKQNIGDEQKLNGDFGTAIEKLGKLNLRMSNLILSADPDNAEPNTGDRMGNIRSLDRKIKATEQSSQQIINSIETVINRVRADIQGVKSSYSPQAHETLKNDLSTLRLSLGAEFQKIAAVRSANKEELEKIEEIFEESVTGLEKFKKKSKVLRIKDISEKAKEQASIKVTSFKDKLAEKKTNTILLSGPIDAKEVEIKDKYNKEWAKLAEQSSQLLEKHDKLEDLESDEEAKSLTTVRREVQNKYRADLKEIRNDRMNIGIDYRLADQEYDKATRSLDYVEFY